MIKSIPFCYSYLYPLICIHTSRANKDLQRFGYTLTSCQSCVLLRELRSVACWLSCFELHWYFSWDPKWHCGVDWVKIDKVAVACLGTELLISLSSSPFTMHTRPSWHICYLSCSLSSFALSSPPPFCPSHFLISPIAHFDLSYLTLFHPFSSAARSPIFRGRLPLLKSRSRSSNLSVFYAFKPLLVTMWFIWWWWQCKADFKMITVEAWPVWWQHWWCHPLLASDQSNAQGKYENNFWNKKTNAKKYFEESPI